MAAVASAAGLSEGTLYNYFRDKQDLQLRVSLAAFEGHTQAAEQAVAELRSLREGLERLIAIELRPADQGQGAVPRLAARDAHHQRLCAFRGAQDAAALLLAAHPPVREVGCDARSGPRPQPADGTRHRVRQPRAHRLDRAWCSGARTRSTWRSCRATWPAPICAPSGSTSAARGQRRRDDRSRPGRSRRGGPGARHDQQGLTRGGWRSPVAVPSVREGPPATTSGPWKRKGAQGRTGRKMVELLPAAGRWHRARLRLRPDRARLRADLQGHRDGELRPGRPDDAGHVRGPHLHRHLGDELLAGAAGGGAGHGRRSAISSMPSCCGASSASRSSRW